MAFEVKFIPDCVSDKKSILTGHVMLRVPTIIERLSYMDLAGVETNEKGEVSLSKGQIKGMAKIIEASEPHYLNIDLKRKDGSYEFKTFAELASDVDCTGVLSEVAMKLLHGFNLSKNLKP